MFSSPQEFVLVCRQLGQAQQRCSAALGAQAAQIEALEAEVVRLRAAVVVRDTRLAWAQEALGMAQAAEPGGPRRKAMARHIAALAERIGVLSRECLRWRLAAQVETMAMRPCDGVEAQATAATHRQPEASAHAVDRSDLNLPLPASAAVVVGEGVVQERKAFRAPLVPGVPWGVLAGAPDLLDMDAPDRSRFAASLAAADVVICQTGCISHDEYWRVQDHCRRTGKPCLLVDQPLAAPEVHLPGFAWSQLHPYPNPNPNPNPHTATATASELAVILHMPRPRRAADALASAEGARAETKPEQADLNEIDR